MLTLFDEEDIISFGSYMISQERKDSITNHPEITNNQDRKEILKIVTPFDFNNWLRIKVNADREKVDTPVEAESVEEVVNE